MIPSLAGCSVGVAGISGSTAAAAGSGSLCCGNTSSSLTALASTGSSNRRVATGWNAETLNWRSTRGVTVRVSRCPRVHEALPTAMIASEAIVAATFIVGIRNENELAASAFGSTRGVRLF